MTEKQLQWLKQATREELLDRWRTAPLGDPLVSGTNGRVFKRILFPKNRQKTTGRAIY